MDRQKAEAGVTRRPRAPVEETKSALLEPVWNTPVFVTIQVDGFYALLLKERARTVENGSFMSFDINFDDQGAALDWEAIEAPGVQQHAGHGRLEVGRRVSLHAEDKRNGAVHESQFLVLVRKGNHMDLGSSVRQRGGQTLGCLWVRLESINAQAGEEALCLGDLGCVESNVGSHVDKGVIPIEDQRQAHQAGGLPLQDRTLVGQAGSAEIAVLTASIDTEPYAKQANINIAVRCRNHREKAMNTWMTQDQTPNEVTSNAPKHRGISLARAADELLPAKTEVARHAGRDPGAQ